VRGHFGSGSGVPVMATAAGSLPAGWVAPVIGHHPDLSRCDRCRAAGRTRFIMSPGRDLVFCGHHTADYELNLTAGGAVRFDLDR
jgi:hypothetical protein